MYSISKLCYEYPGVLALQDVSFQIQPKSIVAVVGPNGAGKTTLFRCMACLDAPFSGEIRVEGNLSTLNPRECHRKIGFLPDIFGLFEELTVAQSLEYFALAAGNPDPAGIATQIAARVGLTSKLQTSVGGLSRGMRQRLGIGQILVKSPKILILDEPAAGLDPEARGELSTLLKALRDEGMTIIVSSHILTELQEYADRMLIFENGKLVSDVGSRESPQRALIHVDCETTAEQGEALASHLVSLGFGVIAREQGSLRTRTPLDKEAIRLIFRDIARADSFPIYQFHLRELDMQEEYLQALRKGNP